MHGLVTFLKACAMMGLASMGVAMTIHNWSHFGGPEPFGGAALLVGALIAFVTWFWNRAYGRRWGASLGFPSLLAILIGGMGPCIFDTPLRSRSRLS